MTRWVTVGYLTAGALITAGCAWFSIGAGLLCGGVTVAALTTLLLLDVGGDT